GVPRLLAGCTRAGGRAGGGSPAPTAPASTDAAGCPTRLDVTAADGGRTVCVAVGGTVTVTTPTDQATAWVGLASTGPALAPLTPTPAAGPDTTVLAAYTAVAPGTATLDSARRNCPPQTGAISCHSIVQWQVTVEVKWAAGASRRGSRAAGRRARPRPARRNRRGRSTVLI